MTSGNGATERAEADASARRRPHSIRFFETEWERIEAFAEERGLTGPEFVRYAVLAAMADPGETTGRLRPLIEMTFRATYVLVTKMRDDMLDEGREAEIEQLVEGARALQDKLLFRKSD
ncbi:MAG: hypothetical protein F4213_05715 [Boseongicola sp. SB0677_bin_26]|nr:hypothetical protein [Boseongicola sp. SB0677_bin_26]